MRYSLIALLLFAGCVRPINVGPDGGDDVAPPGVIPIGKLSVLIVEETDDRAKPEMRPYLGVLNSSSVREYLNTHCQQVGGKPRWLWIDKDADMSEADPYWKAALAKPRKSLPWIAISNGRKGTAGPLPVTEEECLKLLRKWGGN